MNYTLKELISIHENKKVVLDLIKQGKYIKISHGIYSDEEPELSELEYIFLRYPNATLTLQSAVAYYDLSDYVPNKYHISTPLNAHKIHLSKVEQTFMRNEMCDIGRIRIETNNGYIYIYDKERLLIEIFRLQKKLPYDYVKEVINSYRLLAKEEAISFRKIVKYCEMITYGKSIRNRIKEVVL